MDGGWTMSLRCYLADTIPVFHGPAFGSSCDYIYTSVSDNYLHTQIKLLPNPAASTFKLLLPEDLHAVNELILYNGSGIEMLKIKNHQRADEIDISHLPAGFYLVKAVVAKNKIYYGKLVKNR